MTENLYGKLRHVGLHFDEKEYDGTLHITKIIDSHTFEVSVPFLSKKRWEFWK